MNEKQNNHLNLDGINSSYNDGDGLRINNPNDFSSITISNGYFSNNKGNGITIGSPQQSPLEIILNQLAPKLPDTIQPHELMPLVQSLLESKDQEELSQKLNSSGIKDKFKDPNLWISFSSLLFSIASQFLLK
ncbi:hypothetical protein OHV92_05000 [Acinetobacter baumannii]|nr:hypothetical protein [Acinetobacter baumannii]